MRDELRRGGDARAAQAASGTELRGLGGDLSNGDEIVVADSANIVRSEGDERLSSAGRCRKLHDEGFRTVNFDDGAQVASPKPLSRNVMRQNDDVKELWGQSEPPG